MIDGHPLAEINHWERVLRVNRVSRANRLSIYIVRGLFIFAVSTWLYKAFDHRAKTKALVGYKPPWSFLTTPSGSFTKNCQLLRFGIYVLILQKDATVDVVFHTTTKQLQKWVSLSHLPENRYFTIQSHWLMCFETSGNRFDSAQADYS